MMLMKKLLINKYDLLNIRWDPNFKFLHIHCYTKKRITKMSDFVEGKFQGREKIVWANKSCLIQDVRCVKIKPN